MSTDLEIAHEGLLEFLYQVPIGLVQCDGSGAISMMNPVAVQLLVPIAASGAVDNLFDVLSAVAPQLRDLSCDFDARSGTVCEALRVPVGDTGASSGPERMLAIGLFKLGNGNLIATVSDASAEVQRERQWLESELHRAAGTDSLTSLPNRAALVQRLERDHDGGSDSLSVLCVNCDRFKRINDAYGHSVGDALLRLVGDRLGHTVARAKAEDELVGVEPEVARLGGDEFFVILDGRATRETVEGLARRLVRELSAPFVVASREVHLTASIGVVLHAGTGWSADEILQDASIAMHEAKRSGGGRHCLFEPAMRQRAAKRGTIEIELRRALVERELFVVYQPVVDLADRRLRGFEALVRWRHPQRGIVPPGEFIDVAEECGLIGDLGDFVLAEASRQFVAWKTLFTDEATVSLSVNLSRAQLSEADLALRVQRNLQTTGMRARQLQLEITESLAAQDEAVRRQLMELKALGLTLALDDFGTGYSSLSSLHQLPVDAVKIDRSFVSQLETSPHHRVLVEATVRVAQSLGMRTIAEGVETEAQATVLRELGCDRGQGYLFGKPLNVDAATAFIAASGVTADAPELDYTH
jgi:diguanylate cyclase (GGDEF)-like protein